MRQILGPWRTAVLWQPWQTRWLRSAGPIRADLDKGRLASWPMGRPWWNILRMDPYIESIEIVHICTILVS
jgi:hypothetical protein